MMRKIGRMDVVRKTQKIKDWTYQSGKNSGIYRLTRKLKTGAVALVYHGIGKDSGYRSAQGTHLPFSQFEKQIDYVRKNFEVISLDCLHDRLSKGCKIDSSHILITFDDGFKNIAELAGPFLKTFNLPFAVFVATKHLDERIRFPTYYLRAAILHTEKKEISLPFLDGKYRLESPTDRAKATQEILLFIKSTPLEMVNRLVEGLIGLLSPERWIEVDNLYSSDEVMNWDDAIKLCGMGGTIGSHCHDHIILHAGQDENEIFFQFNKSGTLIRDKLGNCSYLAYPEGDPRHINGQIQKKAQDCGFLLGFSAREGEITNRSNQYLLPRVGGARNFNHFVFAINNSFIYNRRYRKLTSKIG